jgi:hypothetical protein
MSNFAFLAGGAHVNEPLGVGRRQAACQKSVEIPCRDRDGLGADGNPRERQEKANDNERQPPQMLHGSDLVPATYAAT